MVVGKGLGAGVVDWVGERGGSWGGEAGRGLGFWFPGGWGQNTMIILCFRSHLVVGTEIQLGEVLPTPVIHPTPLPTQEA